MLRTFLVALAGLACAACTSGPADTVEVEPGRAAPAAASADTLRRQIGQGVVEGVADEETGAHAWKGLPFAAAPEGALRWRAPRLAPTWDGVRRASDFAPRCAQLSNDLDGPGAEAGKIVGEEDCLYLNVYAPALTEQGAADAKMPVMVWIHGGGNTWGGADQYDGRALAARRDLVVVTIQYRLGALGWFAHESLRETAETADDASANFGHLDQIAALEWVRDNIEAFGGDPERVTIFGESAGGHNVAALMASPRAAGLFHRAIIQSGGFRSVSLEEAEGEGEDVRADSARAIALALSGEPAPAADALRGASVDDLFAAYLATGDYDPPRVIQDGVTLPEGPMAAAFASTDTFNAVPVITGTNRDELKLFNILDPRLILRDSEGRPTLRDAALYDGLSRYPSRMWRAYSVDLPADAMTAGGHGEVWAYRFDWDEQGEVAGADYSRLLGAAHAVEIPFVFGSFDEFLGLLGEVSFTPQNEGPRVQLSDTMMSYWANFASTGDPGGGVDGAEPVWRRWSEGDAAELIVFDTEADGGVRMAAADESPERISADLAADPALSEGGRACLVHQALIARYPADRTTPPPGC